MHSVLKVTAQVVAECDEDECDEDECDEDD